MMQRSSLLFFALLGTQASAQEWKPVPGALKQISAASDGSVWGVNSAGQVFRRTGDTWQGVAGQLMQVSVGSAQNIWGVNASHQVWKWDPAISNWRQMPGLLKQISAAADGSVWGTNRDDNIYRWDQAANNWILLPGRLAMAAAGSAQQVWGVTGANTIFRWTGSDWAPVAGLLADISVAADGSVWGVNSAGAVFQWTGSAWQNLAGVALRRIAVASGTVLWGVTGSDGILTRTNVVSITMGPIITITGTPIITSSVPVLPPQAPIVISTAVVNLPSQLLCSGAEAGSATSSCGTAKAAYVGAYALNMNCASGFFDPIHGGTCWKCPDDDGHGGWVRSADAVTKDTACWRLPKEYTGKAAKVKSTIWPHECASGTFWDGGGCWQCPEDTPRRTGYAVWADNACASAINQTKPAAMVSFNGCSEPDVAKLRGEGKLKLKERPGKPFLDIAGGWNQGSASGGCFACPIVDSEGNFLITERNLNPIYGENQACNILVKFRPATFTRPGLSGLNAKALILEANLLDPAFLSMFLHTLAQAKGKAKDSAEARAWVAAEWGKISQGPYRSEPFQLLLLAKLKAALEKAPAARTPAETVFVNAVDAHMNAWRVYMAEQALGMYDAWKKWDDTHLTYARHPVVQLFNFGTVPLDFNGLATTLATPTTVGATIAGTIAANAAIQSQISAEAAKAISSAIAAGNSAQNAARAVDGVGEILGKGNLIGQILKGSTAALGVTAGATVIAAAFAVVATIAFDQFITILTARSKLETAVAEAKKPVSLSTVLKQKNGYDLLQYHWLMALDTASEVEDAQLRMIAGQSEQGVKATGYAYPK